MNLGKSSVFWPWHTSGATSCLFQRPPEMLSFYLSMHSPIGARKKKSVSLGVGYYSS